MKTSKTIYRCNACGTESEHGIGWLSVQVGWRVSTAYGNKSLMADVCGWGCLRAWAERMPQAYVDFRQYIGEPEPTEAHL